MANLFFTPEDVALKLLFSRTTGMFSFPPLFIFLSTFFFLVTITAGISLASGLFVPMMLIGATMGRIMGQALQIWLKGKNFLFT